MLKPIRTGSGYSSLSGTPLGGSPRSPKALRRALPLMVAGMALAAAVVLLAAVKQGAGDGGG